MNKLFMIVLSVCCLLMAACGTDNDETPQGLRIVDTDVDLAAGGGTVEVALQAAGELTAVSGADWCRVIEVTNEKITLLARANYEYVSRATQVTVSDGSNEQKIVVTQAGNIFAPEPTGVAAWQCSFTNRGAGQQLVRFQGECTERNRLGGSPFSLERRRLLARIEREQDRKSACLPTDGQYQ